MREIWQLSRGAAVSHDGTVTFSVWAPLTETVTLEFPSSSRGGRTLERDQQGVFTQTVSGIEPGADYFYLLSQERLRPDPVSRFQPVGVHGPSRVVDPGQFAWSDKKWRGISRSDLVLYELHIGTFTSEGTFAAALDACPHLLELGITAIQLMPVAQFPGERNWGYDGVHLYAPQNSYGGPDGLRTFIDGAHQAGLAVFLDVVYNHLGPEGNYLAEFGPYFTDSRSTPWGPAVNFDGPGSDEVRRYFIDNALYWITEFHLDGLRLDAVHAIYDSGRTHILEELASCVREQAATLGRIVNVIAESDQNDPCIVRPSTSSGYGLDAQWNEDFHHALHALLTKEQKGYYVDFGQAAHLQKVLLKNFALDGGYSLHRGKHHGAAAGDLTGDRFVTYIQNHDQVGNRAQGDRLAALVPFEAQKLAASLLFVSPFIPLMFMGEEYGETNPFLYFIDHGDPQLAAAVSNGRLKEFECFGWQGPIPDPQSEITFWQSKLDLSRKRKAPHKALLTLYTDLIALKRGEPALRPGEQERQVRVAKDGSWLELRLIPNSGPALRSFFHFGVSEQEITVAANQTRLEGLLSTGDAKYKYEYKHPCSSDPKDIENLIIENNDNPDMTTIILQPYAALVCREH